MTGDTPRLRYRLLRGLALQSRKAQYLLRSIERTVEAWTGAILNRTLDDVEKQTLSINLCDASFRPENDHDGLYPWESEWFERRMPPAPASVLVGAAGAGREARALRELGYRVHAFEPSTSAFRLCERALGSDHADPASYQDFVATALRGKRTSLRLEPDAKFDAVLLGWGSFGHVLRADDRFELLRACDRVAPRGPILLSIFEPNAEVSKSGAYYTSWGGFLARPTVDELQQHARALNRELIVSLGSPSSYATLIPNGA